MVALVGMCAGDAGLAGDFSTGGVDRLGRVVGVLICVWWVRNSEFLFELGACLEKVGCEVGAMRVLGWE